MLGDKKNQNFLFRRFRSKFSNFLELLFLSNFRNFNFLFLFFGNEIRIILNFRKKKFLESANFNPICPIFTPSRNWCLSHQFSSYSS